MGSKVQLTKEISEFVKSFDFIRVGNDNDIAEFYFVDNVPDELRHAKAKQHVVYLLFGEAENRLVYFHEDNIYRIDIERIKDIYNNIHEIIYTEGESIIGFVERILGLHDGYSDAGIIDKELYDKIVERYDSEVKQINDQ